MSMREQIREKLYVTNEYGVEYQDPDARLSEAETRWLEQTYGVNTEWHPTCIACQARQMLKYGGRRDKDDVVIKEFRVPCKGIQAKLPPGSASVLRRMMAETDIDKDRALKTLKATIDPVAWAEMMFGFDDNKPKWHLRAYQKEQLRCTSQNLVIREGRRSGKTFLAALKLLYLAFNKRITAGFDEDGNEIISGPSIMIVTPYQSQILNIFDEMEKLLKLNRDLKKRVTTGSGGSLYVKTPFFHLDLENGAVIKGFVSGVGTKVDGSGGGTMRGQNATIIYLDEMDMIPDEVLEKVVLPILLTDVSGDVTLIATSTPIGKRGRFYTWCLDSPEFKEDHLPSTVLPQWERIKKMLEGENSQESFRAEYMAEFIEGSHGVFKPSYVYQARAEYRYEDTMHAAWWKTVGVVDHKGIIRSIGIDWNKNAGTEFVVVGYDPMTHRYFVLEAVNISASEFSSIRWKEEVVRLNYKWKPHYIYADEGYGHTIIEDLKLLAHQLKGGAGKTLREQETAKLTERLVSFNFSSRIELRSPIDGKVMSKTGKEFIVENAVRVFEDGILRYPLRDERLQKELLNYVVLRRSPTTNKPVYGPENESIGDHRLDALMLALAGIQLEMGLYASGAMAQSAPEHLSMELLEKRSAARDQLPGAATLGSLGKQQVAAPTSLEILQIMRSGESPEAAMARMGGRSTRISGRTRGRMAEGEPQGVREAVLERAADYRGYSNDTEHHYQQAHSSPHALGPRRGGRGRRSKIRRR